VREGEAFVESFQGTHRDLLVAFLTRMYRLMRHGKLSRISKLVHSELASFPELARFYVDEVILPARRLLQSILGRGQAAGEFRATDEHFAARAVPMLLIQTAQMQCFFQQFDPDALDDEQTLRGLVDFCLHGVLARPEPTTPAR
jgi:hypothetical protein